MDETSAVDQAVCRYPACQTSGGCSGVCSKRRDPETGWDWDADFLYSMSSASAINGNKYYEQRFKEIADRIRDLPATSNVK